MKRYSKKTDVSDRSYEDMLESGDEISYLHYEDEYYENYDDEEEYNDEDYDYEAVTEDEVSELYDDDEDELKPLNPTKTVGNILRGIFGDMEHIDLKSTKMSGRVDTEGLTIKARGIHFEKTPEMIKQEKKGKRFIVTTEDDEVDRRTIRNSSKKKRITKRK